MGQALPSLPLSCPQLQAMWAIQAFYEKVNRRVEHTRVCLTLRREFRYSPAAKTSWSHTAMFQDCICADVKVGMLPLMEVSDSSIVSVAQNPRFDCILTQESAVVFKSRPYYVKLPSDCWARCGKFPRPANCSHHSSSAVRHQIRMGPTPDSVIRNYPAHIYVRFAISPAIVSHQSFLRLPLRRNTSSFS